jgi:hypothetical protein
MSKKEVKKNDAGCEIVDFTPFKQVCAQIALTNVNIVPSFRKQNFSVNDLVCVFHSNDKCGDYAVCSFESPSVDGRKFVCQIELSNKGITHYLCAILADSSTNK